MLLLLLTIWRGVPVSSIDMPGVAVPIQTHWVGLEDGGDLVLAEHPGRIESVDEMKSKHVKIWNSVWHRSECASALVSERHH